MNNELFVYLNTKKIGTLWTDQQGRMFFQYAQKWLEHPDAYRISISLPLQQEPFPEKLCYSYFTNLLPEGKILTVISRKLGIAEENKFELLEALGGDCAGAISLCPEGHRPPAPDQYAYESLTEDHLLQKIKDLKNNPLLASEEKRLSLAGAMEKIPVYIESGKILLPLNGSPSTHIIKTPNQYPGIVVNEAFCMSLARNMGIDVPDVEIINIGNMSVFSIRRYDRVSANNGIVRLAQEDFCQALNFNAQFKYEPKGFSPGKSTYQKCFELIKNECINPLSDTKKMLEALIFNGLIGNADGHIKNISLLHDEAGTRLSPFYDLVSTYCWHDMAKKMPLKIAGERRDFHHIQKHHFVVFAKNIHLKPSIILEAIEGMAKKIVTVADETTKEFQSKYSSNYVVDQINSTIKVMSSAMLDMLSKDIENDLEGDDGEGMRT